MHFVYHGSFHCNVRNIWQILWITTVTKHMQFGKKLLLVNLSKNITNYSVIFVVLLVSSNYSAFPTEICNSIVYIPVNLNSFRTLNATNAYFLEYIREKKKQNVFFRREFLRLAQNQFCENWAQMQTSKNG